MVAAGPRAPGPETVLTRNGATAWSDDPGAHHALHELARHMPRPEPGSHDEQVVLCIELDGIRYTLLQQRVADDRRASLSAREREIARLISAGHTNKTVAAVLDISLWTVDTHIRRIFHKLGVRSRSAMVARLAELGLLDKISR